MTESWDTEKSDVLATYARARCKRGIGLVRLKQDCPEEYDAFLRVALFFATDAGRAVCRSHGAIFAALTTFLAGEGSWVMATTTALFDALEREGLVRQKEGTYHVSLPSGFPPTLSEALTFLENEAGQTRLRTQQIRAMLQEKNRRVNTKKQIPVDAVFDEAMMREALKEAHLAYEEGEVPVGAVLTRGKILIARDHNRVAAMRDATAHAEMRVLKAALDGLNSERLPPETTLYVTLEPCPMCAGALLLSRVRRVVWGASDSLAGAMGSRLTLQEVASLNWKADTAGGVLQSECEALLERFFSRLRQKRK